MLLQMRDPVVQAVVGRLESDVDAPVCIVRRDPVLAIGDRAIRRATLDKQQQDALPVNVEGTQAIGRLQRRQTHHGYIEGTGDGQILHVNGRFQNFKKRWHRLRLSGVQDWSGHSIMRFQGNVECQTCSVISR